LLAASQKCPLRAFQLSRIRSSRQPAVIQDIHLGICSRQGQVVADQVLNA
jgi:hypothetical protein